MSALSPFVRAFRALSLALVEESKADSDAAMTETEAGDPSSAAISLTSSQMLFGMAKALNRAATGLEQQIAADLSRIGRQSTACPKCKAEVRLSTAVDGKLTCPRCVEVFDVPNGAQSHGR